MTKNGYAAAGVCDGVQALTALEAGYYDRIISDIMMPNVDGYALVRTQARKESGSCSAAACTSPKILYVLQAA